MGEQKIVKGQTWERKRDGTLVQVAEFNALWDDVAWRTPDGARRGQCYGSYFRRHYTLVGATS